MKHRLSPASVIIYLATLAAAEWFATPSTAAAAEPNLAALEKTFQPQIRPLLVRYCQECHSSQKAEAEIDLEAATTFDAVRKQAQTWQKVGAMLDSGQMPPKDAPQPTEAERARLQQWVHGFLTAEAQARAGDPGRVVLRRLSNAEYTYTLRDLTGVESLRPAREFPVDGAAGEGFTNTGAALVMSPALLSKYLDAAKDVAAHAVLLPDGVRFSPSTTRRDWTDENLSRIRQFYRQYTDPNGSTKVNLQGLTWETNEGGRLPLDKYLLATIEGRESLLSGGTTIEAVARAHGLNAKYLKTLWSSLTSDKSSPLLDRVRHRWRAAQPGDVPALQAEIAGWQKDLWRFTTVGHIGKVGGPKSWLEPVNPLVARQEVRLKLPAVPEGDEVTLTLAAADAGLGDGSFVVWERPRLTAPGRRDLLLRDVRQVAHELSERRQRLFASAARYLAAAAEAAQTPAEAHPAELARQHDLEAEPLAAWLDYLGVGTVGPVEVDGRFTTHIKGAATYDFIQGWGNHETPLLLANSSDQHVRVPGNMRPHSVAVHPSPTLRAAVGWRSPITGTLKVTGKVVHAHPECGNGVTWSLEFRRGSTRRKLAAGVAQGATEAKVGPIEELSVQPGDLVSLLIGPRDGNHACDLTAIDLELTAGGDRGAAWNLAADVSGDILAGNPHADKLKHDDVWHFYTEPEQGSENGPVIPAGSLLAQWQNASAIEERNRLAGEVQQLLIDGPPEDKAHPDAVLYRQLASLSGPLLGGLLQRRETDGTQQSPSKVTPPPHPAAAPPPSPTRGEGNQAKAAQEWGLDPVMFGRHPAKEATAIDAGSLCLRAPAAVEIRLPADLVAGCELVAAGILEPGSAAEGAAQLQARLGSLESPPAFQPGAPILAQDGSPARQKLEAGLQEFRDLFPAALCYMKIVPVDEVVTLTLFYREDDQLCRLMLDDAQQAELNRLWDELHYVSQDALTLVDAFAQLMEYATQDADPKVFEPLRKPILDRAEDYRRLLIDTEPRHLEAVLAFAALAYRRPLSAAESQELQTLYSRLREQELPHDEALRLTLARVLVSPAFLYRIEKPGPGTEQSPVSDWELASRLSYFLWSSPPDAELRRAAAAGELRDPAVLLAQTRRMLADPRTRRLATEFACQWLHIYDFDALDEKSERHFPTFAPLRGAMYEESIRFFTDLFQNNGSVLGILDADHTFLNEELAAHYGIPGVSGAEWRRVDGLRQFSRGGILGQATTLATQSGASRTSPILRGNWISEVLLGERLPRPPKDVPRLPEDETATDGLTVRQLVEQHSSNPKCAVCHKRIDPLGFALEGFDAIGRKRDKDLGDRAIDTRVTAMDGAQFDGLPGLREYLLTVRREAFLRQFCRKLLGYALGRSVQLSDEPLLAEMQAEMKVNQFGTLTAVETIVRSRQFRDIRGRETAYED